jgi:hypothetical protein
MRATAQRGEQAERLAAEFVAVWVNQGTPQPA